MKTKTVVRVGYIYNNEWVSCGRGPTILEARKNLEDFLFSRVLEQTFNFHKNKSGTTREQLMETFSCFMEDEKSYRYIEQDPIQESEED